MMKKRTYIARIKLTKVRLQAIYKIVADRNDRALIKAPTLTHSSLSHTLEDKRKMAALRRSEFSPFFTKEMSSFF